jgi:hypothetical protein
MYSAGTLTLHVRSGAANQQGYLSVQKYDEEDWTTLAYLNTKKQTDFSATSIDEVITCPININEEVKLRLRGGNRYTQIFKLEITPYGASDIQHMPADKFHIHGRKLTVRAPTCISLYNAFGVKVFEQQVEHETMLPPYVGSGVFMLRTDAGMQKVLLK